MRALGPVLELRRLDRLVDLALLLRSLPRHCSFLLDVRDLSKIKKVNLGDISTGQ